MTLALLPELVALDAGGDGVRLPPGDTVPLTPRVRALLDTQPVRRLARISQLGLVSLVYPGAVHTRLEHSLGVYRLSLEFLRRLRSDPRFVARVTEGDAAAFVAAALLHDVGHWAYCHPLEDMGLPEIPTHESLVPDILARDEIALVLTEQWQLDPARVAGLITGTAQDPAGRLLQSLLSGPVDIDKMDYLARDSLHAGVPYGSHFDRERLLGSLCLDDEGGALAITSKGRTAAELMVFARYVMFSEVYWHHAVRAATAMLQRAIWLVRPAIDPETLIRSDDQGFAEWLLQAAVGTAAQPLAAGLFGPTRQLFKRAGSFDARHSPSVHQALAGRGYATMAAVSARLAETLSHRLGRPVAAETLIIDAPPAEREVEFRLQVREDRQQSSTPRSTCTSRSTWRPLEDLSPVVRSLAHEQFDDLVKRVRVFAPPNDAEALASLDDLDELLLAAARG
jgi:hypothetical protein